MRIRSVRAALALLGFLVGAVPAGQALAWGSNGHRVVGAMADQLLTGSNAQRQVAALLLPGESLAGIATWPDCVKGSFCGPQTPEMLAYVAANPKHEQYHYTNIAFQQAHYRDGAVGSAANDIVQTLKQAIAVLQGNGDDPVANPQRFSRRQALILLVHLVGDIGQPLHVGEAYIHAGDANDAFVEPRAASQVGQAGANGLANTRGGNRLLLDEPPPPVSGTPAPLSFHSYWDSAVVDEAMRRAGVTAPEPFAAALLASRPQPPSIDAGAPSTWPYRWADDTLRVAAQAYAGVTPGRRSQVTGKDGVAYDVWTLNLPTHYRALSVGRARDQLTASGYRLTALLRAIWP